mgnify:CR=1 FL=1
MSSLASWLEHAAFLPLQENLNVFNQAKYTVYPNSMLKACLADWSSGSLYFIKFYYLISRVLANVYMYAPICMISIHVNINSPRGLFGTYTVEATYKEYTLKNTDYFLSLVYKFLPFIRAQKLPQAQYKGTDFWQFHAS